MVVVSSQDKGAQDFLDAVWPNGELFIDEQEAFKKAFGAVQYSNWWLLKPSVLSKARSYFKLFGTNTVDTFDTKTQMLGGVRALLSRPCPPVGHMPTLFLPPCVCQTFVVVNGNVVYTHHETKEFDNGNAREMLAAVLGKDVTHMPQTPEQEDIVCTR